MYSKYKNKRTAVDGIIFHSKKEAGRYSELKILLAYKKIEDLRLQVRYPLEVNGHLICTYVADFVYRQPGAQTMLGVTIEDVKGYLTPEYKIKKKLFEALMGMKITEI